MPWISFILYALALYALAGALLASLVVTLWIARLDPAARGLPWSVRALLWPGCVAAWPILWRRLASASRSPVE